nr:HPr family phosphocarrier protein [uncultured Faecalimonas sp.]
MKSFEYTVKDEMGIHARPAGILAKEVKKYESKITITKEGKTVEASRLMAVMSLAVKCGQTVEVQVEGSDEEAAYEGMKAFFEANL